MRYRGRSVDVLELWGNYVDFPHSVELDGEFLPKVKCPNPEHDTHKRHFQINTEQATVHCFAHCGISGSYEHALCVIHGLYDKYKVEEAGNPRETKRRKERAYREARKIILRHGGKLEFKKGGRPITEGVEKRRRRRTIATPDPASLSYETYLPAAAVEYIDARGISPRSVSKWGFGWLPDDSHPLVIPARDENGILRFLVKRAIRKGVEPKYLYTEGYPKTHVLFGACFIDPGMIKSHGLILDEGSIDTIMWHQHGLPIAGGILGTGISRKQVRIIDALRPKRIFLAFDKDLAGLQNIEICAAKLRTYPLYVIRFPKGMSDPGDIRSNEEALRAYERAIPLSKFVKQVRDMGITFSPNVSRPKRRISVG